MWPVIAAVLGSLVPPGLMTLVRRDKAKPYLISALTPAASFIEKSLSISQGCSICHLIGGQTCFCGVYWQVKVQGSRVGWPYKYRARTGGTGSTGEAHLQEFLCISFCRSSWCSKWITSASVQRAAAGFLIRSSSTFSAKWIPANPARASATLSYLTDATVNSDGQSV